MGILSSNWGAQAQGRARSVRRDASEESQEESKRESEQESERKLEPPENLSRVVQVDPWIAPTQVQASLRNSGRSNSVWNWLYSIAARIYFPTHQIQKTKTAVGFRGWPHRIFVWYY